MASSPEEEATRETEAEAAEAGEEEQTETVYASDNSGSVIGVQGARSGLSLGPTTGRIAKPAGSRSAPLPEPEPAVLLNQGVQRAKHMGVALGMVLYLLAKHLFSVVIASRMQNLGQNLKLKGLRTFHALQLLLSPHIERLRQSAKHTKNKTVRSALLGLLVVVMPIEQALMRTARLAKAEGTKLSQRSARKTVKVVMPLLAAIAQAFKAGLKKATIQRLLTRVMQILEDAQAHADAQAQAQAEAKALAQAQAKLKSVTGEKSS